MMRDRRQQQVREQVDALDPEVAAEAGRGRADRRDRPAADAAGVRVASQYDMNLSSAMSAGDEEADDRGRCGRRAAVGAAHEPADRAADDDGEHREQQEEPQGHPVRM